MSSLLKLAEQSRLSNRVKHKPGRELTLDMIKPDSRGAPVARYIFPFVKKSGISNLELAEAMNYPNHSTMSMIRTGQARLPLAKAPKLTEVL